MRVTGIGWAGVLTEGFDSTLRFFSDVLGLHIAHRDTAKDLVHFRFRSGQLLEVYGPSNRQRKEKYRFFSGPALGFEVDEVELARQEMIARGIHFITELESWEEDRWSLFLDPQDKLFEILRAARRPASGLGSILGICHARVFVWDFANAVHFFSEDMQMALTRAGDGREIAHCQLPNGDSFEVSGSIATQGAPIPPTIIGFEVDDMMLARRELEAKGLEFLGPSEMTEDGKTRSSFCGPDGVLYELIYVPKHPS
jgi:predicted enzyme related to lactoylglutathione lyase